MGKTVLVITENPLSAADVAELTAGTGVSLGQRFVVAVPQQATARSTSAVIDDLGMDMAAARGEEFVNVPQVQPDPAEVAYEDAAGVLDAAVAALTGAGFAATGQVTPQHPLETVGDLIQAEDVDEVVVMVRHQGLGAALHTDLAARIERHYATPSLRLHTHR